jgi:hypothetical protein
MVINTKELSARIKFGIMLSALVYAGILVASIVLKFSESHIFEIVLTIVFVLSISFTYAKKYSYIFYNSDGPKIIIRYTSLQPMSAGNFSIEVPKRDFVKAEIKKSLGGLRKDLIIFVRTPQGVAKFNPVSLSTLSKVEYEAVKQDLSINNN